MEISQEVCYSVRYDGQIPLRVEELRKALAPSLSPEQWLPLCWVTSERHVIPLTLLKDEHIERLFRMVARRAITERSNICLDALTVIREEKELREVSAWRADHPYLAMPMKSPYYQREMCFEVGMAGTQVQTIVRIVGHDEYLRNRFSPLANLYALDLVDDMVTFVLGEGCQLVQLPPSPDTVAQMLATGNGGWGGQS